MSTDRYFLVFCLGPWPDLPRVFQHGQSSIICHACALVASHAEGPGGVRVMVGVKQGDSTVGSGVSPLG